jgi:hypothetical protein
VSGLPDEWVHTEHVGRIDADRVPGPKLRKIVRVAVAVHNQSPSNCSKSGM